MLVVMNIAITVINTVFGTLGLLLIIRLLLQVFKVRHDNAFLKFLRTVTDPILNITNKWLGIPTYRYSLPSLQSEAISIIGALIVIWAGRTVLVWLLNLAALIPVWVLSPVQHLYAMLTTLLGLVFELYFLALYVRILLSWLRISTYGKVTGFLYKITEPVLAPIRQVIPSFAGIDISPIIAVLILQFLRNILFSFLSWIF